MQPVSTPPYPQEPDAHRRARHLFTLRTLTERGFALALKAAARAEAELDAPESAPEPAPEPSAAERAPNPHQVFDRYVRLVRLLVAAEHRIANPAAETRGRYCNPAAGDPGSDPRRPPLRHFLHQATRNSPDRADLRRATTESLDQALERDPARTLPADELLGEICQTHGLPFDLAQLPDAFLEPPDPGPPNPH
ncbi:MAG: hypothetical protein RQ966_05265 [Acetobacteraceae bacterium]|nr:hypothetical protein [Acetobacteraceae bacterium]